MKKKKKDLKLTHYFNMHLKLISIIFPFLYISMNSSLALNCRSNFEISPKNI